MSRIFTLLFVICSLSLSVSAQVAPEPMTLVAGQSVERELAGGASHRYQITLAAGQFVRFRLEQQAIDTALLVTAPDGKQLIEMDLTGNGEQEAAFLEAAVTGNYQVHVRSVEARAPRGSYRLDALAQATATVLDHQRLLVQGLLLEAEVLTGQGARAQALEKRQQALLLLRKTSEPRWEAYTLYRIGLSHANLAQYEKAIEYYEQSLVIAREVKDRAGAGYTLGYLGRVYESLSRYEKAIECQEQALTIAREVKDRKQEGIALNFLGRGYELLNRFEKAIECYEQALVIRHEVKDRWGEAVTLGSFGDIYTTLGRYEKAMEYYEQSLAIRREVKDRRGEAIMLDGLSTIYSGLGQYEKAITFSEQSLAIARELKDRSGEGSVIGSLAMIYSDWGRFEKAIEYYEQALVIWREIKDREGEGGTLNNLGIVYSRLGQYEKAITFSEQSLAITRELKDRRRELFALSSLARAESVRGNLAQSRSYYEEGLAIAEWLRNEANSPESRAAFLAERQISYQRYTDVLMRLHKAEPTRGLAALAVETSERQRARSLLDLLAESRADLRQGVDAALLERERTLARQLSAKAQTQAKSPAAAAALKREISQLEDEYERVQAAIRKASPHYAALTQPQPLKLQEIQQQLDADTLLLEYALGKERSYLWAITKDGLLSYELPKEEDIKKNALQVYELLTARSTNKRGETPSDRRTRLAQAEANLPAAAQALSQTLLGPVAAELGTKRLVIVADGALQYIPFAMLPEPEGEKGRKGEGEKGRTSVGGLVSSAPPLPHSPSPPLPLIVQHEIISLPSASALAIQRTELAGRQPAPKLLAVIADPVFDRTDERLKAAATAANVPAPALAFNDARSIEHIAEKDDDKASGTTRKLVIPRLPYTRQEAAQLLALTPKSSSFSAMDFQANRMTVLDPAMSQYRYVHFATHGVLDSERPGLSSLVLSMVDAQGKPQDGFLRANDIYNLKLPAELVVLSACQTGLGKDIKGEGLVGLTRGFMYAGAARVVVSLWSVNDRATADLMTRFYQKILKQGERPAAALRAAQVEMWKQQQWQAPYYWAAFVLQGEWK